MQTYIRSICNIDKKTFELTIENNKCIYLGDVELQFSFVSNKKFTKFDNLRFGYWLDDEKKGTISTGRFPEGHLNIEMCDDAPVHVEKFHFESEANLQLHLWVENAREIFAKDFKLKVQKPPKPHDSWIWYNNDWIAPIPPPTDCDHRWDEKLKDWIIVDKR